MTIAVKICGLTTQDALTAALEAGADYIGLVFFPPSPRHLSFATAEALCETARGRAYIVALTVNAGDNLISDIIERINPDFIQAHGRETPQRVQAITAATGVPLIKALPVADRADVAAGIAYAPHVHRLLYDARPPDGHGALPGGNGLSFDWRTLDAISPQCRDYMLSGGLNADTVRDALKLTGATAVDVSSGVEITPGVKDPALIRRFIATTKSCRFGGQLGDHDPEPSQ